MVSPDGHTGGRTRILGLEALCAVRLYYMPMGGKGIEPSSLVLSEIFGDQFPTVGDPPESDVPDLNGHQEIYSLLFFH